VIGDPLARAGLSGAQELRLTVLDLVRRMTAGEDAGIEDMVAMAAWVIDGDMAPARQLAEDVARRTSKPADAVRYVPDQETLR
jgi:hypothetical protein